MRLGGKSWTGLNPLGTAARGSLAALSLLSIGALQSATRASVIVQETFTGYSVGAIAGQAATGTGETGNWAAGASITANVQATGLSFGDFPSSNASLAVSSTTASDMDAVVQLASPLGTIPGSGSVTFYSSFLFNGSNLPSGNAETGSALIESSTAPTAVGGTARDFSTEPKVYNGGAGVGSLKLHNTGTSFSAISTSTTYLYVTQYTRASDGSVSGQSWILTPSGYDSVIATPNFTTSTLTTYAQSSATRAAVADTNAATTSWMGLSTYSTVAGTYGNITYGTALADVVPLPEPGVGSLLLATGAGLLARRRRR